MFFRTDCGAVTATSFSTNATTTSTTPETPTSWKLSRCAKELDSWRSSGKGGYEAPMESVFVADPRDCSAYIECYSEGMKCCAVVFNS